VSSASVCASFGGTAVYRSTVFVPCRDGVRAVTVSSTGHLRVRWHASPPGSPIAAGGRVWSLDPKAGRLHALDVASGRSRGSVSVGQTSRFATPAIRGSDLLVPTLTGLTIVRTR
jgi:sugar lactone lactonase YvrE